MGERLGRFKCRLPHNKALIDPTFRSASAFFLFFVCLSWRLNAIRLNVIRLYTFWLLLPNSLNLHRPNFFE